MLVGSRLRCYNIVNKQKDGDDMSLSVLRKMSADLHLVYQKKSAIMYGDFGGYFFAVQDKAAVRQYLISTWVKPAASDSVLPDAFLASYCGQRNHIAGYYYGQNTLTLAIKASGSSKNICAMIYDALSAISGFLSQNRYVACCADCGCETGTSLCLINDIALNVCDSCYQVRTANLSSLREQEKSKPAKIPLGVLGAILGALIGAVLWVVIYHFGYIAGIAGFVMSFLALKFYGKFSGKVDLPGTIIAAAIAFLMVFAAQYFAMGLEMYLALSEYYVITLPEALQAVFPFMQQEPELARAFAADLIVGYILTAAASIPSIVSYYRIQSRQFRATRLAPTSSIGQPAKVE